MHGPDLIGHAGNSKAAGLSRFGHLQGLTRRFGPSRHQVSPTSNARQADAMPTPSSHPLSRRERGTESVGSFFPVLPSGKLLHSGIGINASRPPGLLRNRLHLADEVGIRLAKLGASYPKRGAAHARFTDLCGNGTYCPSSNGSTPPICRSMNLVRLMALRRVDSIRRCRNEPVAGRSGKILRMASRARPIGGGAGAAPCGPGTGRPICPRRTTCGVLAPRSRLPALGRG